MVGLGSVSDYVAHHAPCTGELPAPLAASMPMSSKSNDGSFFLGLAESGPHNEWKWHASFLASQSSSTARERHEARREPPAWPVHAAARALDTPSRDADPRGIPPQQIYPSSMPPMMPC